MSRSIRLISTRDERFRFQFERDEDVIFKSDKTYPTPISAMEHALLKMKDSGADV